MKNSKIYSMTLIALFAALICIVSPFSIPIGLVPISLSSVVILLSTYIIGYKSKCQPKNCKKSINLILWRIDQNLTI